LKQNFTAREKISKPEPEKYVICVDAGHGYDDPGTDAEALGDWSEKDITLDIALRLGAILEKAGCEVAYTRTDDIIPEDAPRNEDGFYLLNAYDREKIMKSLDRVDAFVSVHCDFYDKDPKINGVRIFYYRDNSKNIAEYAGYVADGIEDALKISGLGGVTPPSINGLDKDNAYYVTKCTDIPSVLVETGFVTNQRDVKNMLTEKWRQDMAQGIADGIIRFLGIEPSDGGIK
jgi:N-acetylmuramoyl-L-alanine amidase